MAHHVFHRGAIEAAAAAAAAGAPTFAGLDLFDWDPADLEASPVASWTDAVQGIELTAAGSARPAWLDAGGAQALNFPCVHYDGIDDLLQSASGLNLNWNSGISMFLVKERISVGSSEGPYVMYKDGNSATTASMCCFSTSATQLYCTVNRDSLLGYYTANVAALNTTSPVIWSLRMIDSLGHLGSPDPFRQNEVDSTTGEGSGVEDGPISDVDNIVFGGGYGLAKWNAYQYRILFYAGRDMTEAEETEVIDYLNTAYGVY